MRSHPKKLHLLMPDAAPRGDSLYVCMMVGFKIIPYQPFTLLQLKEQLCSCDH